MARVTPQRRAACERTRPAPDQFIARIGIRHFHAATRHKARTQRITPPQPLPFYQ